jgi:class 3 adenylate cyclase
MPPVRRLTAILAADVAGYSRLMGADEEGTHERLRAHLRDLIEPKIAEHRGRIVKNTGDGFLAEFASVVDAVRCAVEMQRGMAERNDPIPPWERIEFRIGINLGDVIAEREDIFGDAVNIAARLEAVAEPGGICVSGGVHDQIRDKLPHPFTDIGEQQIKNIARPVRVYALRAEFIANLPPADIALVQPEVDENKQADPKTMFIPRMSTIHAKMVRNEADFLELAGYKDTVLIHVATKLNAETQAYVEELVSILEAVDIRTPALSAKAELQLLRRTRELIVLLKGNDVMVYAERHFKRLPERWEEPERPDPFDVEAQLILAFGPPPEWGEDTIEVSVDNGQPRALPYAPIPPPNRVL